jgi:hypothetical protein
LVPESKRNGRTPNRNFPEFSVWFFKCKTSNAFNLNEFAIHIKPPLRFCAQLVQNAPTTSNNLLSTEGTIAEMLNSGGAKCPETVYGRGVSITRSASHRQRYRQSAAQTWSRHSSGSITKRGAFPKTKLIDFNPMRNRSKNEGFLPVVHISAKQKTNVQRFLLATACPSRRTVEMETIKVAVVIRREGNASFQIETSSNLPTVSEVQLLLDAKHRLNEAIDRFAEKLKASPLHPDQPIPANVADIVFRRAQK